MAAEAVKEGVSLARDFARNDIGFAADIGYADPGRAFEESDTRTAGGIHDSEGHHRLYRNLRPSWQGERTGSQRSKGYPRGLRDREVPFVGGGAQRRFGMRQPVHVTGRWFAAGIKLVDFAKSYVEFAAPSFSYVSSGLDVEVDRETGKVGVVRSVAAADCGRPIYPLQMKRWDAGSRHAGPGPRGVPLGGERTAPCAFLKGLQVAFERRYPGSHQ